MPTLLHSAQYSAAILRGGKRLVWDFASIYGAPPMQGPGFDASLR